MATTCPGPGPDRRSRARTSAAGRCSASSPSADTSSPRAGSPTRSARYLVLRVARIYPAFVVCLLVTAGVFAPIAWSVEGRDWSGFLTTPTTPPAYVLGNLALRINAYDVAGTPSAVPYPGAWNGSLWTLYFEFLCYLLVGLLVCLPVVRRHRWLIVVAFAGSVVAWATVDAWGAGAYSDVVLLARLLPAFLGGAVVWVAIGRVPLRTPFALAALAAAASSSCPSSTGALRRPPRSSRTCCSGCRRCCRHRRGTAARHLLRRLHLRVPDATAARVRGCAPPRAGRLRRPRGARDGGVAVVSWRLVERPALRWARHRFRSPPAVSASGHGVPNQSAGRVPPPSRDDAG